MNVEYFWYKIYFKKLYSIVIFSVILLRIGMFFFDDIIKILME